jgi:hypothetical protein
MSLGDDELRRIGEELARHVADITRAWTRTEQFAALIRSQNEMVAAIQSAIPRFSFPTMPTPALSPEFLEGVTKSARMIAEMPRFVMPRWEIPPELLGSLVEQGENLYATLDTELLDAIMDEASPAIVADESNADELSSQAPASRNRLAYLAVVWLAATSIFDLLAGWDEARENLGEVGHALADNPSPIAMLVVLRILLVLLVAEWFVRRDD